MSLFSKESDLLEFIVQKKKSILEATPLEIVLSYTKIIINAINKSYEKIKINIACLECINTVSYLYWLILKYSNNLKLTMFLCDRAILLFNEYLSMTIDDLEDSIVFESGTNSDNSFDFNSVKLFVYKKTIGPLEFGQIKLFPIQKKIEDITKIVRHLFIKHIYISQEQIILDDYSINLIKYLVTKSNTYLVDLNNFLSDYLNHRDIQFKHIYDFQIHILYLIDILDFKKTFDYRQMMDIYNDYQKKRLEDNFQGKIYLDKLEKKITNR